MDCEVVVSGKLRCQRAKCMKFVDGLMIHSGDPFNVNIQQAVRHVQLRQSKQAQIVSWDIVTQSSLFRRVRVSLSIWLVSVHRRAR